MIQANGYLMGPYQVPDNDLGLRICGTYIPIPSENRENSQKNIHTTFTCNTLKKNQKGQQKRESNLCMCVYLYVCVSERRAHNTFIELELLKNADLGLATIYFNYFGSRLE